MEPADHALLVEEEGRGKEEVAAPAGGPMADEGRRHAVTMPDVERVHERAALVGEEADREVELPAELLRDVARIDAHRDPLDAPVEDVPVVLAELAELRHAERSPVPPVAEDEQAVAASGREAEGRAVGGRQREVGEALADARPVLARAVHREGEEKPAREDEDADGEERADRGPDPGCAPPEIHAEPGARRDDGQELPRDPAIAREAERGEEVEPEAAGRDEGREDRRHGRLVL